MHWAAQAASPQGASFEVPSPHAWSPEALWQAEVVVLYLKGTAAYVLYGGVRRPKMRGVSVITLIVAGALSLACMGCSSSKPQNDKEQGEQEARVEETGDAEEEGQREGNPVVYDADGVGLSRYSWIQEDDEGYQFEMTATVTGWLHGNDESTTNAAWAAVGGIGETPNYFTFAEGSGLVLKPDDCVIVYGVMTAKNITPGFAVTADNPKSPIFGLTLGGGGYYSGASCYQDDSGATQYITSDRFNYVADMPRFRLTNDEMASIRFAIAYGGGAPTPKNGDYDPALDSAYLSTSARFAGSKEDDYWVGAPRIPLSVAF